MRKPIEVWANYDFSTYSSTLKMVAVRSSGLPVNVHQTTRRPHNRTEYSS
jgi:hypothetical protein